MAVPKTVQLFEAAVKFDCPRTLNVVPGVLAKMKRKEFDTTFELERMIGLGAGPLIVKIIPPLGIPFTIIVAIT